LNPKLEQTIFKSSLILKKYSAALRYTVEVISDFKNLYHFRNYYISGQPTLELFQWLKSAKIQVIINLRSDKENTEFTAGAFNESTICREMGLDYYSIPVDGMKDYTPAKLDTLSVLLNREGTVFIHCASGGRVTDFFMAYLVKSKGFSINEDAEIGRKLRFSLPVEKLLDTKINLVVSQ
jgi:protein tyrosine phosphatase (PTP) superfamily phosphohydrolase (DUF442 family)